MHPSIVLMLRSPQNRAIAAQILARLGNRGDTMLAHINPAEAWMLKRMGGSGTINPRTGIRQFDPPGGSNAGGAGHAGDSGNMGGRGDGGSGRIGGGLSGGGYNGQGRGWSGAGGGTMAGPYGGHLGGNTSGGAQMGSAGAYAHSGGLTIGPGSIGGAIGGAVGGPIGGLIGSGLGSLIGGEGITIGGTDNRIGAGMGIGGSAGGPVAGNVGQNGGGQGDHRQMPGLSGRIETSGRGTNPAPGAQPAGLPPVANPALAGLYFTGLGGDPLAGRFGSNPFLLPYLIAANQPANSGYLSGLWR